MTRRRVLAFAGVACQVFIASVLAVLQWGVVGVPISAVVLGALLWAVVASGWRTDNLYRARTESSGVPTFLALLGGERVGDLFVQPGHLIFSRIPRRALEMTWDVRHVAGVRVVLKGRLGSAAVTTIESRTGERTMLEVSDGGRLITALRDVARVPVTVEGRF